MAKDINRVVTLDFESIEGVPDMFTLDPGTMSGWAYYAPVSGKVECGQLGPRAHQNELLTLIELKLALSVEGRLEVLFERFEFRQFEEELRSQLRGFINGELRGGKLRSLSVIIDKLSAIANSAQTKHKIVLDSREYIGIAKLATQRNGGRIELASQMPSEALSFASDNVLDALGWLKPTAGLPHARDALRHLVKRLVSRYSVKHPITTACFAAMRPGRS